MNAAGPSMDAIDVGLGRQVGDNVWAEIPESLGHRVAVADVDPAKAVALAVVDGPQRREVAGIGQLVEVEHVVSRLGQQVPDQGRADEAGAAGDENTQSGPAHVRLPPCPGAPWGSPS